jgi:hypothetical protein
MARLLWKAIRPAVFWSYKRGSWQYDIMVALILAFIFFTPRNWFRDQPQPQQIVMLQSEHDWAVFLVDPGLIRNPAPEQLEPELRRLLEQRAHRRISRLRTEPAHNAEGRLTGYLVHATF